MTILIPSGPKRKAIYGTQVKFCDEGLLEHFLSSYPAPSLYNLFSLKQSIFFHLRFFSSDILHWFSSFYDVIAFFFFSVYQFLRSYACATHITLWVVYVNNNNKNPWSFIPLPSGIPLTSFQLEKVLSMADFFSFPLAIFSPLCFFIWFLDSFLT